MVVVGLQPVTPNVKNRFQLDNILLFVSSTRRCHALSAAVLCSNLYFFWLKQDFLDETETALALLDQCVTAILQLTTLSAWCTKSSTYLETTTRAATVIFLIRLTEVINLSTLDSATKIF